MYKTIYIYVNIYNYIYINIIQYQSISSLKVVAAKDAGAVDGEPSLMPNACGTRYATTHARYTSSQQRGTFRQCKTCVDIYIYIYVTGVTQLTGSPRPDHLLGLKEIPNV